MTPRIFFCFDILIFIYILKYKTIETQARTFLPPDISAVGSVSYKSFQLFGQTGQFLTNLNFFAILLKYPSFGGIFCAVQGLS